MWIFDMKKACTTPSHEIENVYLTGMRFLNENTENKFLMIKVTLKFNKIN